MSLSKKDRQAIEEKITEIEKTTAGEIVTAVLDSSDDYPGARWRLAFVFSLLATYIIFTVVKTPPTNWLNYILTQCALLPMGFLLANLPALLRLSLNRRKLQEEVHQRATQLFVENNLHDTKDRTGILIFISKLEHQVVILADKGINEKVDKTFWQSIIDSMTPQIRQNKVKEALLTALETCQTPLSQHFPIKADDTNELTNKVITS